MSLEKGYLGEEIAAEFLTGKGYKILERNWRSGHKEIDIIAKQADILVFVEVKSRKDSFYGEPWLAVGKKKEQKVVSAATDYLHQVSYDGEIRFDVVSILQPGHRSQRITHFEDAFFPGL